MELREKVASDASSRLNKSLYVRQLVGGSVHPSVRSSIENAFVKVGRKIDQDRHVYLDGLSVSSTVEDASLTPRSLRLEFAKVAARRREITRGGRHLRKSDESTKGGNEGREGSHQ